ncbi:MAG: putative transcriptional regulator, AsnC family protein [Rhodococcus erythropolis]|jgi:DNA-binding Lrp family transcriptional regulator|nr:putative transcriptional regulator, AsnC family protein [Rhodococcus erythropolis]
MRWTAPLIDVLVRDNRISMRSLSEEAHISRADAYVRVERLQREGVVRGFTTQIEHCKAGWGSSAFVSLTIGQGAWRGLAHQLRSLCWVDHFALLGDDFDVLILVRAPDNSPSVNNLFRRSRSHIASVQFTSTEGFHRPSGTMVPHLDDVRTV